MAKGRKTPAGKGRKKKGSGRSDRRSWLWPAIITGILLLTLTATFVVVVLRPEKPRSSSRISRKEASPIHYEQHGRGPAVVPLDSLSKKPAPPPAHSQPDERTDRSLPPVAIVIDDMGYQQRVGEELLGLDLNLTFAFLPHGPHTPHLAAQARRLGRDVLLHFPMEPDDPKFDPGPGSVTLAMGRAQIRAVFEDNLRLVPQAQGINNHMGSRFTQNEEAMRDFLVLVRERHLFFLDSMTSRTSVGYILAREMGVRTGRRNIFLDDVREPGPIKAQIRKLLALAGKEGSAVGIGHPYPQTLAALRGARAEILGRARLVGVSRLMH